MWSSMKGGEKLSGRIVCRARTIVKDERIMRELERAGEACGGSRTFLGSGELVARKSVRLRLLHNQVAQSRIHESGFYVSREVILVIVLVKFLFAHLRILLPGFREFFG